MRAGLSTLDRTPAYYGLGLTLGNAEVRLDELVAAYRRLRAAGTGSNRHGRFVPTTVAAETSGHRGRRVGRLARSPRSGSPTSSPTLSARESVFGRGGSLEFPFPVAVKTGTSQAYHDNWTIGYTAT